MDTLIKKLIAYIPKNIAGILGIVRAIIKLGKEISTLCLDIIAPLIPGDNDDKLIKKVRDFFNMLDGWVGRVSDFLLKMGI